jgi:hypothetical protein
MSSPPVTSEALRRVDDCRHPRSPETTSVPFLTYSLPSAGFPLPALGQGGECFGEQLSLLTPNLSRVFHLAQTLTFQPCLPLPPSSSSLRPLSFSPTPFRGDARERLPPSGTLPRTSLLLSLSPIFLCPQLTQTPFPYVLRAKKCTTINIKSFKVPSGQKFDLSGLLPGTEVIMQVRTIS